MPSDFTSSFKRSKTFDQLLLKIDDDVGKKMLKLVHLISFHLTYHIRLNVFLHIILQINLIEIEIFNIWYNTIHCQLNLLVLKDLFSLSTKKQLDLQYVFQHSQISVVSEKLMFSFTTFYQID